MERLERVTNEELLRQLRFVSKNTLYLRKENYVYRLKRFQLCVKLIQTIMVVVIERGISCGIFLEKEKKRKKKKKRKKEKAKGSGKRNGGSLCFKIYTMRSVFLP
ncbi:MAG: hypothetical protein ACLT3H_09155 [Roseburia sp.]